MKIREITQLVSYFLSVNAEGLLNQRPAFLMNRCSEKNISFVFTVQFRQIL